MSPTRKDYIQYRLIYQFYGIEEFVDLPESLPCQVNKLNAASCEFSWIKRITDLDIWYIKIESRKKTESWCPFTESLSSFLSRHDDIIAHFDSQKQYSDRQILSFLEIHG